MEKKIYERLCEGGCGRIVLSTAPNKFFCKDCLEMRRAMQSASSWQRTKRLRACKDKQAEEMEDQRRSGESYFPADYLARAEIKLMDRAGIQYGSLQKWKIGNPAVYSAWVEQVKLCFILKPADEEACIIPDELPEGLSERKRPEAHSWGGVHTIDCSA